MNSLLGLLAALAPLLAVQAVEYTTAALADKIDSSKLPGADQVDISFNQFSGYLDGILLFNNLLASFHLALLQWTPASTCTIGSSSR